MSKKDYLKAVEIVRKYQHHTPSLRATAEAIEDAFVNLFNGDNPQFDERRFRDACK